MPLPIACAANALGMIETDDYAFANQESEIAMRILAEYGFGIQYPVKLQCSIIQTGSFEITKTISQNIKGIQNESITYYINRCVCGLSF